MNGVFTRGGRCRGFSLIEVMVAVSIFAMLTVMMAALFQQSSNAWRGGSDQARGYMELRSAVGALQRDMVNMVDKAYLENVIGVKSLSQTPTDFTAGSVSSPKFYVLRNPPLRGSTYGRGFSFVQWTLGSAPERVETFFDMNGQSFDTATTKFITDSSSRIDVSLEGVATTSLGVGSGVSPALYRITVKVRTQAENTYDIGAVSFGPDGVETKSESAYGSVEDDDIRSWTKQK